MKYFLYCRKSTEGDERQALSLPAQERELKELAIKEGLIIEKIYKESKSARIPNKRLLFKEMLERIRKGDAQGIICWAINRLSRNWQEGGELMQMLTEGIVKEIITPDKRIDIDNTNDIVLGVEFGQSSQFSKELSKNVKRGLREKYEKGQYPRSAPNFYINVGINKFDRNIAPDPKISKHFEPWVDYILESNASLQQATNWLNERGIKTNKGKTFKKSSVHRMLQNPVYCGIYKYSDLPEKDGDWDPLISKNKYRKLQSVLGIKRKPQFYSHAKGYKGLILCKHCGCSITCSHKIKNGKSYIYYHCTKKRGKCPQPYITEQNLEDQIFENITEIQIDKEGLNECLSLIKKKHTFEVKNHKGRKNEYHTKQLEIDKMINVLIDMRLKKQIDQDTYETKKKELIDKKKALQEKYSDNDFNQDKWIENLENFFETCFRIEFLFNNGTIEDRNNLVKAIGKNLTLENGVLGWNFRKPWDTMIISENEADRPKWWRRWESNPRPRNNP